MEDILHAPKLALDADLAAAASIPRGAAPCWQAMTRLAIDNRADAIDYLVHADPPPRLSTDELAALLNAFPALPTTSHTSAAPAGSQEIRWAQLIGDRARAIHARSASRRPATCTPPSKPASQYRPALVRAAAEADVLLLAGDLTHMGHVEQARSLAAELWDLGIKIVAVTGNHDHQQGREKAIAGVLTGAGVHMLEGASVVLSVRGIRVGIAGVKGFGGGFPGGLVHEFGEPEVKAFAAQARRSAESLATALTGLEADVRVCSPTTPRLPTRWPAKPPMLFPLLGSYLLGDVIDRSGITLAVHGHAHHGSEHGTTPGGVPVRNVARPVIGTPYRIYTLTPHRRRWRLEAAEQPDEAPLPQRL